MAMMIKISPEGLRAAANKQAAAANQMEEVCSRVKTLTADLETAWQGNAGEQAANGLAELYDAARNAAQAVGASANKLKSVAALFEAVDEGNDLPNFIADAAMFTKFIKIIGCPRPGLIFKVVNFLNIDTDAVRNVAGELTEVSAALFEIRDRVGDITAGLNGDWEGRAYMKYADESKELVSSLDQLAESVTTYAAKIRRAADRYEELDNTLMQ